MRNEGIEIKSSGLILLAVIPGAFVEPDENAIKKKKPMQKLRVYAAGSFGNFFLAAVMFILAEMLIAPMFFSPAVGWEAYSTGDNETYPAQAANMSGAIISIDGNRIQSERELATFMDGTLPGQLILVKTEYDSFEIVLEESPIKEGKGYIGIAGIRKVNLLQEQYKTSRAGVAISFVDQMMRWIGLINLGIGIVNLLPLKPLDGGLMFEEVMEKVYPNRKDQAVKVMSALMLALLVGSLLGAFL